VRIFEHMEELQPLVGTEIAVSDWVKVGQDRIDQFAHATGDHQWIHVDADKSAQGPFGATIAHGFLTLSLIPAFYATAFEVRNTRMGINYGLNKVRFPAPVPVDSELRARFTLQSYETLPGNGAQTVFVVTIERNGSEKPVCIAESISRRYA
jgi:acyl dehydratase